jgi:hypothetical protein
MTLASAVVLLQAALALLTLVESNPNAPLANRAYAVQVAQQAITEANAALTAQGNAAGACGNGDDYYDGGTGEDTLTYSGRRSDFTITQNANGSYTFRDNVPCRAGTDTVVNVERFLFADGAYSLQTLRPDSVAQSASAATCTFTSNSAGVMRGISFNSGMAHTAENCKNLCTISRNEVYGMQESGVCVFTGANHSSNSVMSIAPGIPAAPPDIRFSSNAYTTFTLERGQSATDGAGGIRIKLESTATDAEGYAVANATVVSSGYSPGFYVARAGRSLFDGGGGIRNELAPYGKTMIQVASINGNYVTFVVFPGPDPSLGT